MNRDLIFIALALMTWGLGESAFYNFQPLYLEQLGANPVQIGAILGGVALVAAVAHIPVGYLSDRLGRRPLMVAAWVQGTIGAWIIWLAPNLPVFIIGMVMYGMTAYVSAPMASYVTAARGKWEVGRALTLMGATYNLGAVLGPLIGGWLGERLGYRPIFLFAACLFVLSSVLISMIRPQPVEKQPAGQRSFDLLGNRGYLAFLAVYLLATFAMYLSQPLSPNFLQNQRQVSLLQIGQLISISSLGIVVLSQILGRMNPRTGYLLAHVGTAIFTLLIWRGAGMLWYGMAYALVGSFRIARSMATAHIRSLVSGSSMGLAYGVAETTGALALVLAPVVAGLLYERNPEWMYLVSMGLIVLSLLVNVWVTAPRPAAKILENSSVI